jgi:hypothetical protein
LLCTYMERHPIYVCIARYAASAWTGVEVAVNLRPTVSQPVRLGAWPLLEKMTRL